MKTSNQLILNELEKNPEVALVLEIATRAREIQERELPQEIRVASEIAAVPAFIQHATA